MKTMVKISGIALFAVGLSLLGCVGADPDAAEEIDAVGAAEEAIEVQAGSEGESTLDSEIAVEEVSVEEVSAEEVSAEEVIAAACGGGCGSKKTTSACQDCCDSACGAGSTAAGRCYMDEDCSSLPNKMTVSEVEPISTTP